jgi:endonuclease YncB( thermonuclease family)
MTRTWAAVILGLMVGACRPGGDVIEVGPGPGSAGPAPADLTTGTVVRVNDGDSVLVETGTGDVEVRMMGINSPELDECFGPEAHDRLTALVDGQEVGLEIVGQDQFDRTLAHLWLGDLLIDLDQVAGGFAIATTPPAEGDPHGGTLLDAEEGAYTEGWGLWSETVCGASGPGPAVEVDEESSSFDPRGPDEEVLGEEWVALTGDEAVDLGGWVIRDESSEHRCHLPSGLAIEPGVVLEVTSLDPCWDPGDRSVWNNGGDMALLLDTTGRVVARHRYVGE